MFKDNQILEGLKKTNKKLDRIIAMQNAKRLKEIKEEDNELIWFFAIVFLLLNYKEREEENV